MRNDGFKCHERYFVNRKLSICNHQTSRVTRKLLLLHMQTTKVQASLRIRAVSPEPLLTDLRVKRNLQPKNLCSKPIKGLSMCTETLKLRTVRMALFLRRGTILFTYYM